MAYRITRRDRSLQKALRRIAREQIDAALDKLTAPGADPDDAVHQIRKHCKKLRGLLRLVRPGFRDFARENAAIRDLAQTLSGLRDTGVMVETHDTLLTGATDAGRFDPMRAQLVAHAPANRGPLPKALQAELKAQLEALRARAVTWTLKGKDKAILRKGLGKTWSRADAAFRAARADPSAQNMHEWRKRVKYNWYHSRLLRDIRKPRMQPHREDAKRLGDLLGTHHDAAVYLDHLAGAAPGAIAPAELKELTSRATAHKARLERRAFALGARMFNEKPAKLPERWAGWWRAWRRG